MLHSIVLFNVLFLCTFLIYALIMYYCCASFVSRHYTFRSLFVVPYILSLTLLLMLMLGATPYFLRNKEFIYQPPTFVFDRLYQNIPVAIVYSFHHIFQANVLLKYISGTV